MSAYGLGLLKEYLAYRLHLGNTGKHRSVPYTSLRKIVWDDAKTEQGDQMLPLRKGR